MRQIRFSKDSIAFIFLPPCYNIIMTENKWLTITDASFLAKSLGLDRTNKTLRSWCRGGHVTAEKQTNRNGEIWVIDRESLITKIKSEIEFRDQERGANPVPPMSEPMRTSADQSEPVRTHANLDEPRSQQGFTDADEALRAENLSLKMEVKFNEKLADQFKKEYLKGQEALQAQARYIGHIESHLKLAGQTPDQTFLKAPVPSFGASEEVGGQPQMVAPEIIQNERPHPDQSNLYTG